MEFPVQQGLAVLSVACFATGASACLPPDKPAFWRDKPISVGDDCSFDNAEGDYYFSVNGRAVKDLGGGRVGQRLLSSDFCGSAEWLLVVDCSSQESILIAGGVDPEDPGDFGGGPSTTVDMLYPPRGKVRLTKSTTIKSLEALADREGYDHSRTFDEWMKWNGGGKKKNAYNQFCGCALFYPGTPGASK